MSFYPINTIMHMVKMTEKLVLGRKGAKNRKLENKVMKKHR
jgi:hypothetical protein